MMRRFDLAAPYEILRLLRQRDICFGCQRRFWALSSDRIIWLDLHGFAVLCNGLDPLALVTQGVAEVVVGCSMFGIDLYGFAICSDCLLVLALGAQSETEAV